MDQHLIYAAHHGKGKIVKFLISIGVDVKKFDEDEVFFVLFSCFVNFLGFTLIQLGIYGLLERRGKRKEKRNKREM